MVVEKEPRFTFKFSIFLYILLQLDMSCLNALPESLQNEIRQAYAMQAKQNNSNSSSVIKPKSPSKSPNKR